MVRLYKERFPPTAYSKLNPRKIGPVPILQCVNDNAYILELPPHPHTLATFNVSDIYTCYPPDEPTDQSLTKYSSSYEAGKHDAVYYKTAGIPYLLFLFSVSFISTTCVSIFLLSAVLFCYFSRLQWSRAHKSR